ncbi:MAG TPA: hypothetical protein VJ343_00140 [archaeon]|nr:hypothetical protein [archaeon]
MDIYLQTLRYRKQFALDILHTILWDLAPHEKVYEIYLEQKNLIKDIRNSIRDYHQQLKVRKASLSKEKAPVGV